MTHAVTSRRRLLTRGLAGVALAPALARAAVPALDLSTKKGKLRAYMMMRGALDDQLVIGFISGRYYGVVGDEIRPLYGVVGATFARYKRRADGGYDGASYEVPFFTDLQTGAALDQWRNPYTDALVDVPQTAYPPAAIVITPELEITVAHPPPGLVADDRVVSIQSFGADVWMTEETISGLTIPGLPKPIRYSEIVQVHALSTDFPGQARRVPCQTAYTSIVSWRPWLKMGDRSGHLMGNGAGGYGVTMETLPQAWRAAAAVRRPDVIQDPGHPIADLLAR